MILQPVWSYIVSRPYVPKAKRWNKARNLYNLVCEKSNCIASRFKAQDTWKDIHLRYCSRMAKFQRARRNFDRKYDNKFVKNMNREKWKRRFDFTRKSRKRTYNHPWQRIVINNTVVADPLHAESTNSEGEEIHDNCMKFDTDSAKIGIDNRASACISHRKEDFVGPLKKVNRAIKGFGGERVMNVWQGTIVWKWCDNNGQVFWFKIPNSYYVPSGGCRLLSPQHWAKTQVGGGISKVHMNGYGETTTFDKCVLFWNRRHNQLDVQLGPNDNVATFYLAPGFNNFSLFCQQCNIDYHQSQEEPITAMPAGVITDDENDDDDDDVIPPKPKYHSFWDTLTTKFSRKPVDKNKSRNPQPRSTDFDLNGPTRTGEPPPVVIDEEEEKQHTTPAQILLRYHHRFNHISMAKLQNMAKQGIIPRHLAKIHPPACSACLFSKMTRRQWRNKRRKHWSDGKPINKPGDLISVDQLRSPTPGLVAQLTGKLTHKRYNYATVYVDQYSGLGYVYLQKKQDAEETIRGKKAFEAYCQQQGVRVQAYHADNGIFRANKWVDECRRNRQTLTFAGVNAHHTNGLAERRIRSLQDLARAMMIHHHRRWNMGGTVHLWPYALKMANDAINETPNLKDKEGRSPLQMFSNSDVQLHEKHWAPFGCPVYVLDRSLQGEPRIHNKWEYRSRVGIYLGRSPNHGRNIALVLDRKTGLVSPQFHVKFDRSFQTIKEDRFDTLWQMKAGFYGTKSGSKRKNGSKDPSIYEQPTQNLQPLPDSEGVPQRPKKRARMVSKDRTPDNNDDNITHQVDDATPESLDPVLQQNRSNDSQLDKQNGFTKDPELEIEPGQTNPGTKQDPNTSQESQPVETIIKAMTAELSQVTVNDIEGEIFCFEALFPNYAGKPELDPLQVFKATSDPDTMYMHEAMEQPDKAEFRKAMRKEWDDQINNGNFSIVHRSSVPEGALILPAVWQMKRKRDIKTRQVKKYKARLNIDGSRMQHGKHYDQSYAPVASWNSIRTLLIVAALFGWCTRQIDYVLAFPQAPVGREVYMKIPGGFTVVDGNNKDYLLKLHRNVYGQKDSGRVFYQYLRKKLVNEVGFVQSEVDECVFYRGNVMYVLYTDDSLLAGPDQKEVEKAIEDIRAAKLDITIEGDIQDFLGVNITRREDGTVHLTQPHLIDQILEDLHMEENVTTKTLPAPSSKILSRHSDSEDFDNSFNYRSVIGKLNYLEKGSRPDIAYITHQYARCSSCPKIEY